MTGNKNKTISFRVNKDALKTLRETAEEWNTSLSAVFRDHTDTLVAHDGQVQVVPRHELEKLRESKDESLPPTAEVPKGFVCEHECLELGTECLHKQLEEHKGYMNYLREQVENDRDNVEKTTQLEGLDTDDEPPFRPG